jgi:hypothetical protein
MVVRQRSFFPSQWGWRQGMFASASCRNTSGLDAVFPRCNFWSFVIVGVLIKSRGRALRNPDHSAPGLGSRFGLVRSHAARAKSAYSRTKRKLGCTCECTQAHPSHPGERAVLELIGGGGRYGYNEDAIRSRTGVSTATCMIPSRGVWKSFRMKQPRAATRSSFVILPSLESGSRARRFSGSMAGTSELLRQALKNSLRRA